MSPPPSINIAAACAARVCLSIVDLLRACQIGSGPRALIAKKRRRHWTERQRDRETDGQMERQTRAAHAAAIFIEGGGHFYIQKALQSALSKIYWGSPANLSIWYMKNTYFDFIFTINIQNIHIFNIHRTSLYYIYCIYYITYAYCFNTM